LWPAPENEAQRLAVHARQEERGELVDRGALVEQRVDVFEDGRASGRPDRVRSEGCSIGRQRGWHALSGVGDRDQERAVPDRHHVVKSPPTWRDDVERARRSAGSRELESSEVRWIWRAAVQLLLARDRDPARSRSAF
jgi:hypothetical protein